MLCPRTLRSTDLSDAPSSSRKSEDLLSCSHMQSNATFKRPFRKNGSPLSCRRPLDIKHVQHKIRQGLQGAYGKVNHSGQPQHTLPPSPVGWLPTDVDLHVGASLSLSRPLLEGIAQVGRRRSKALQSDQTFKRRICQENHKPPPGSGENLTSSAHQAVHAAC